MNKSNSEFLTRVSVCHTPKTQLHHYREKTLHMILFNVVKCVVYRSIFSFLLSEHSCHAQMYKAHWYVQEYHTVRLT